MKKKTFPRTVPRKISRTSWYYVNPGSVDLIAEEPGGMTQTRLSRKLLQTMLAELRPLRKTGG